MKQALEIDDLPELAVFLTAAEAADYLRISEWALRHWVSVKKVRFIKIGRPWVQEDPLDRSLSDYV
jgi:excisionase family DNA binding protein